MNTKYGLWWLAALVLAAAGFGRGVTPRHWQYKTCSLGDPHEPCELNAMGSHGWELVAATSFTWNDGTRSARVFLKREIP